VQSSHNAVVQTIISSPEERKIEVLLDSQSGAEQVVLRYSTWTDGLGWCSQKTIHLDHEHLDELHRALTVARHRVNRRRADSGEVKEPAKVIQLPSLS
jgi:hypothetical protein